MKQSTALSTPSTAHLITQGEFAVSDNADLMITTLLGSCVACCLWDETARVGGMNHLLLAGDRVGDGSGYDVAGVAEMEFLINGIVKLGGRRDHLKAKVFGGSSMIDTRTSIGETNAQFAFDFLQQEKIECLNSSVGGTSARALRFWPVTGRVNMRFVAEAPPEPAPTPQTAPTGNDMELF